MHWLNYHHLLYFWTIAREGSITRAAERLLLTQPTLSNQLKSFEEAIGQPLFVRTGRRLELTEMGQTVYRYAEEIFTLGQDLQRLLSGKTPTSRKERLTIGISDSVPKLVIYRILEPLLAHQATHHFVCLEDDNLTGLLERLSRFELDLVLADAPVPPGSRIRVHHHLLGESGVSFFATALLANRCKEPFPACLNGAPLLLPSANTGLRRELDEWLNFHELRPEIIGEFDDPALIQVFGQQGRGLFCLPSVIERDVCKTLQVEVVGRDASIKNSFYAVSIDRRIRQPVIMDVVERARQKLFR